MTPQGLYTELLSQKINNSPEAANIVIPGVIGWAGSSHGPCN